MGFKEEWEAAGKSDKENLEEEIMYELMEIFRAEETSPGMKIAISRTILDYLKKDNKLPILPNSDLNDLTEQQLIKIIRERQNAKKN